MLDSTRSSLGEQLRHHVVDEASKFSVQFLGELLQTVLLIIGLLLEQLAQLFGIPISFQQHDIEFLPILINVKTVAFHISSMGLANNALHTSLIESSWLRKRAI